MANESLNSFTPRSTSLVSKAVSNIRSIDSSIRARIHFAEDPLNPYIQKLIGKEHATAVTWSVQGIKPHGSFELQVRQFGDLRNGQAQAPNPVVNLLTLKFLVACGGNSGWRYRTIRSERGALVREAPVIVADERGKAQGVSIERDLRVQDVLGRMIVIREVAPIPEEDLFDQEQMEEVEENTQEFLGVIGRAQHSTSTAVRPSTGDT